jgi:hypothetical protein
MAGISGQNTDDITAVLQSQTGRVRLKINSLSLLNSKKGCALC